MRCVKLDSLMLLTNANLIAASMGWDMEQDGADYWIEWILQCSIGEKGSTQMRAQFLCNAS